MLRRQSTSTAPILATFVAVVIGARHQPVRAATSNEPVRIQMIADDMCCKGCAQKVAAQLYALPGVTSVEADVPNRTLVVTAKPSPKLTLARLWEAVEKGKGGPSKLVTPQITYTLTRPDKLQPEQRLPAGRYSLMVRGIQDPDTVQRIANQLYTIRGVKSVSIDTAARALVVEASEGAVLSPWALAGAVEQAQDQPVAIGGPHGWLRIERPATGDSTTAARSVYSQVEGEIR
jgi:copper chaperone CopZ